MLPLFVAFLLANSPAAKAAFSELSPGFPTLAAAAGAWGDYDNDGDLDLILAGFEPGVGDRLSLWRNDPGGFHRVASGLPTAAYGTPAWGDFDNDGDLDLAILVDDPSTSRYATEVWRNTAGAFSRVYSIALGTSASRPAWADWDGDGDLDLFFTGPNQSPHTIHILRNDRGTFVHKAAGVEADAFAVSDYDGDGDADMVVLAGSQVRLWRNDRGNWIDVGFSLSGVSTANLSWADFDQDGDPDLFVSARMGNGSAAQKVTRIFRNDAGTFVEVLPALPAIAAGGLAWGDFDNDGRIDLAGVIVNSETANGYSAIFRNQGGTLTEASQFGFQFNTSAAWADYDGDGDLDLLLCGGQPNGNLVTRLLRNDSAVLNAPPAAPGDLSASMAGSVVTLAWKEATDAQTTARGLTYNLRIGKTAGGQDVMSPEADLSTGRRRLPQFGNATAGNKAKLLLPAGNYYWSVQAIDSALAGGPFAPESTFTVSAPEPAVTTEPASDIAATQVTLEGELDPRASAASVWFEWGTTTAYPQRTRTQTANNPGWRSVSESLAGLQVGAVYHYRLAASTAGGATVFGADQSFQTKSFLPGPAIAPGVLAGSHDWADYDGDGKMDVLVGTFDSAAGRSSVQLWRNIGAGFIQVATDLPAVDGAIAWGDYDRDGDLDIVCSGWSTASPAGYVTQIWRYAGGQFADIGAGLPGSDGTVAWGDFDNDGDLDLLITGNVLSGQSIQIWRNNAGTFTQLSTRFPALTDPRAFWADYDNDGDLDLLITGGSEAGSLTRLYRHDGLAFNDTGQTLRGFQSSDLAWADYDNDGDLDLAIAGLSRRDDGTSERTMEIWRNNQGTFSPIATQLAALQNPKLAWADFDNDGDVDLVVTGSTATASPQTKLFRNDQGTFTELNIGVNGAGPVSWMDDDQDLDLDLLIAGQVYRNEGSVVNSPPSAPANLSAALQQNQLLFRWDPSSDGQTPAAGLRYHLRIGTQAGQSDVVASQADVTTGLLRTLPSETGHGTQAFLSAVTAALGTYYWSVQAIDSGNAGGSFAPESTFTFSAGAPLVESGLAAPTSTSAIVSGMVHPRGLLTTVWLEWGKTTDYGQVVTLPTLFGPIGLDVTANLADLEIETVYHCRLVARNASGTTQGADLTFKTGRFTLFAATPTSVTVASAAWNDLDNDSDLDLVISGTGALGPVTQVWWNDHWIFRPAIGQLAGVTAGNITTGDFDGDGDVDLLICGNAATQIWRNRLGVFSLAASLPGLIDGHALWADYDNDGDLDLLLCGWDGASDITQLWRNDSGNYVPSGVSLPQRPWPQAAWADYDKDGDLDLLLIGADLNPASAWVGSVTELWRNDNAQFSKVTLDLPPIGIAGAAWADYDAEGNLDVLLNFDGTGTQIRRNRGDGFVDSGARLPALSNGSIAWGDYDGDGDLDVALAGRTAFGPIQQIWRNDAGAFADVNAALNPGACVAWADFDHDGDLDLLVGAQVWRNDGSSLNAPPSSPSNLSQSQTDHRVDFGWNAASDDLTPAAGLSYLFRLEGLSAGGSETLSIKALERGTHTFYTLPAGIYYWKVQALDAASVPGEWSAERRVVVSPDTDGDGLPDVWETLHGLNPASAADALADSDGDGSSNLEEYLGNTNPHDPGSLMTIIAAEPVGQDLLVSFSTARGQLYRVEVSPSSPNGPWTTVAQNLNGTGGLVSVTVPGGQQQAKVFYRVFLEP